MCFLCRDVAQKRGIYNFKWFFWGGVVCCVLFGFFFFNGLVLLWRLYVSENRYLAVINKLLLVFLCTGDGNRVCSITLQEAQQS